MGNLGSILSTRQDHPDRYIQESDKKVPCGCCFGATPPYLNPAAVAIVGGIFLEAIALFVLFYLITEEGRYFIIMNVVFHMTAALWLVAGTLLIYRQMRARCAENEAAACQKDASETKFTEPQAEPILNGPSRHSINRYYPALFAQQAKKHQQMNNHFPTYQAKYSMLHRQDHVIKMVADDSPICISVDPPAAISLKPHPVDTLWENQPSYSSVDMSESLKTRQML